MNINAVFRYVGIVLLINALFLLLSALISAIYLDLALRPLLYSALVTALFGVFPLIYVPPSKRITANEALVTIILSWLLSCLVGTLPYILWGGEFSFTNAWFESVSGYTTTGSSILQDIEALPFGLLFWRSVTNWLGGMGIMLFVLAVLPSMGMAGVLLARAEMSLIAQENFRSTVKSTLKIILTVYIGLTALETVSLMFCGMNLFDSITHSFATIATGGFSCKNASIAHYNSLAVELVIILFMVFSGIHFGLIYSFFFQKNKKAFKGPVVKYYLGALIIGVILMCLNIYHTVFPELFQSLRYSAFQLISIGTSTGFANADSSVWPPLSQLLLLFFALQCACAGSTSGGIKTDRIVMVYKAMGKQIKLLQHPRAIFTVRLGDKIITDEVLMAAVVFICIYLGITFLATALLALLGMDLLSAFSGVVAAIGNVGPGLGSVGSTSNFSQVPAVGKWILTAAMLLGRLEIYGLIIFFQPTIWAAKQKPM
ncbi:MAG TPA: potassium transporter TrkG [bacterium]|nr:potassium transporter TrkG [bacterium]